MNPPQIGFAVMQDPASKKCIITLKVFTEQISFETFFCNTEESINAAKQLHEQLLKAGKEARHLESGLVLVKGGLNGSGKAKQGRQQRGPSGTSA